MVPWHSYQEDLRDGTWWTEKLSMCLQIGGVRKAPLPAKSDVRFSPARITLSTRPLKKLLIAFLTSNGFSVKNGSRRECIGHEVGACNRVFSAIIYG